MRAKIKRTRGGSLSVSEIESIINEINNNYGIKKEGTEIYVNIDSDMDELKKLLSMSEEGIDDYFKNKVNGVKNILELLNSLKENVNDEDIITKIKIMDTGFLPLSIRDKFAVLFNGIPVAPPMESVIPVAPPMESVIPVAPPMESVVPVAPPMESVVPVAPPRTDLLKDISKGFKLKNIKNESVTNNSITGLLSDIHKGVTLKKMSNTPKIERPTSSSPMSGLLGEIEKGVQLKKVTENTKEKVVESPLKLSPEAQQIVQRRAALGYSDEEDDGDDGWQGGLRIRFGRRVKSKRNSKKVKSKKRSHHRSLKR